MRKILISAMILTQVGCFGQPDIDCYSEQLMTQIKQDAIDSVKHSDSLILELEKEKSKAELDSVNALLVRAKQSILDLSKLIDTLSQQITIQGNGQAIISNDSTYLRVKRENANFWVQLAENSGSDRLYLHFVDGILELWSGKDSVSSVEFRCKLD